MVTFKPKYIVCVLILQFCIHFSTLSSGLSSMSALVWQDFVRPHTKPMSEFKATVIAKMSGKWKHIQTIYFHMKF